MTTNERIKAFVKLGKLMANPADNKELTNIIKRVSLLNHWFIPENVSFAMQSIANWLQTDSLSTWVESYFAENQIDTPKKIAVIMAGNIPLVGFHDFLCVLISGNRFVGKLSSKDDKLLRTIAQILIQIEPRFQDFIRFETAFLKDFDAVIATGSNNSARYFEHYFGNHPHIIRKNRSSVAVLSGNETVAEIKQLGEDIFSYFGLGCRNVSKLYVPDNYDFKLFFEPIESFSTVMMHHKYMNNYDYNKAILLINKVKLWDNNFVLLKEDLANASPISVLNYEYYSDIQTVKNRLDLQKDSIQCVLSHRNELPESIAFGKAQQPLLSDYADNVDTMKFLRELN